MLLRLAAEILDVKTNAVYGVELCIVCVHKYLSVVGICSCVLLLVISPYLSASVGIYYAAFVYSTLISTCYFIYQVFEYEPNYDADPYPMDAFNCGKRAEVLESMLRDIKKGETIGQEHPPGLVSNP